MIDLHTSEVEAKLYDRLANIEELKKIAPELGKALKDTPAYEGDVQILNDGDAFRIDFRQLGKGVHNILQVAFPKDLDSGEYRITSELGPLDHRLAKRLELVNTIVSSLLKDRARRGEARSDSFLTAWQANAQDAANALEELLADKGLDARVEFVKDGNASGTMSAAVVWCGNDRVASFEFEGTRRYSIVWYVFGDAIDEGHFEGAASDVVKKYSADVIDALELCHD